MSPDLKFESSFQKEGNPCMAYRDYYSEYNGPIGGDYRFKWICETYFKKAASENEKVLDIGCGEGTLVGMLSERGYDSYGIDASISGINQGGEKLKGRLIHSDIESGGLPFPDKFFDYVCCFETFEHLLNPYYILREVKRILKQDGVFLVSIPNVRIGHPVIYPGLITRRYFADFLEVNGMKVTEVRGWGQVPQLYFIPDKPYFLFQLMRRILHIIYTRYTPVRFAWLWIFEAVPKIEEDIYSKVARETKPLYL